jgi:DNA-binding NtrC family response regulator
MDDRFIFAMPTETPPESAFSPWLRQSSILVVDDEPGMRNFLMRLLAPRCGNVREAADAREASAVLDSMHFDVVILDNVMTGKLGVQWLEEIRAGGRFTDVILITAFADLDTAIQALRAGAADFVLKPFRSNQILNAVARCLDRARLNRENFVLRRELALTPNAARIAGNLIGRSEAIQRTRTIIARAAPMPTTVLITGESGTGKEVAARALHMQSPRADKPFVPMNCAAIAPEIVESELFGHLKGAFTGAASSREGLLFYAQGGTLFLDEIGELPLGMQAKLLRVIEDKRVRPVGAEREIPVDVRIVAATNGDLVQAAASGRFRQDLLYRLNVLDIHMPPLRDRPEDVGLLARMFVQETSALLGVPALEIDDFTLTQLEAYGWPGNVRELRNVIERSLILGAFPPDIVDESQAPTAETSAESLALVEKRHILRVLDSVGSNRAEAARRLGVSRKTLDRKCAAWNV